MEPFFSRVKLHRDRIGDPSGYPFCLPAVGAIETLRFDRPVTFLVGENGSGKSTLIESLAVAAGFNAEGGTKNFNFGTSDTHSPLHDTIALVRGGRREKDGFFLRAESFYNVASEIDALEREEPGLLGAYGNRSMHQQSHGESFLALVSNRFRRDSLFILDEPEAALSPARQLALLQEIDRLVGERCQFVIATHSPLLMAYPESRLYWLGAEGAREIDWRETEHYALTKSFLEHPYAYLRHLRSST